MIAAYCYSIITGLKSALGIFICIVIWVFKDLTVYQIEIQRFELFSWLLQML